jgi:outer membrane immunogenic protein
LSVALIAAASTIALTQIASAADMARPVYKAPPPAPIPVQDWSGIYVGLEGGYGWGKQDTNAVSPGDCFGLLCDFGLDIPELAQSFPDVAIPSPKQNGWLFGGFFGAQKQWGNWVLGIEGDIDGADIKGSATSSAVSNYDFLVADVSPGVITKILVYECETNCVSLTHSISVDSKIDMLGSMRGKVGFVPAPDWLIYGTGGAA